MKLILTLTAAAALSACALTPEQKVAMTEAAVAQVHLANEAGIDPLKLDAEKLALLSFGCEMAPLFRPESADDIKAFCAVVQEAAK